MRLFHFSDDPAIDLFMPRPVKVPSLRPAGRGWLNGPLAWAIDDWHQPMYFFPRDCPRILIWPTDTTTAEDHQTFWGKSSARMIAFIERNWFNALRVGLLYRYELSLDPFETLNDAGMWVSRDAVRPIGMEQIADLPKALRDENVELRQLDSLLPLKKIWSTSLHASGIRLRKAAGWANKD
jgi:hypothetical protein